MKKAKLCTALPVSERHSDDRRKPTGMTVLSKNNFKTIFVLLSMILLSVPAFAVPGEYVYTPDGNKVCDVSDVQQLRQKLEKEFYEKHINNDVNGRAYNREVDLPVYKLLEQKRKAGHCGFARY